MTWQIKYKKKAWNFLSEQNFVERFESKLEVLLSGKGSVDIKKLSGKLEGHFRIRIGKVRIIFKIDVERKTVFVKRADFRGDVYKG